MSILSLQVSCFADLDVNFHLKKLRAQVQLKVEGALKKALRNYWLHVAEILRLIFTKNHKSIWITNLAFYSVPATLSIYDMKIGTFLAILKTFQRFLLEYFSNTCFVCVMAGLVKVFLICTTDICTGQMEDGSLQ